MTRRSQVSLRALAREMDISAPYLLDLEHGNRRFSSELQERHSEALQKLSRKNPALASS